MPTEQLERLKKLVEAAQQEGGTPLDVLVVDDSELSRQQTVHALNSANIPVNSITHAEDGREATAILKEKSPHLIFTDYHMPRMNGQRFIEILHALGKLDEVCVILCTVEHNPKIIDPLLQLGLAAYIRKPINADTLKELSG